MNDFLIYYADYYNITKEQAEKKRLVNTENGTRTAMKELVGQAIIKKEHLFDEIFPENIGYKKITDKKLQKAGCDYCVYFEDKKVYVDIKVCIGENYSMKTEDFDELEPQVDLLMRKGAPFEIYQNKAFTFVKGKITDYVLFIFCDKDGISYSNIDYEEVRRACLKHKDEYIIENGIAHLRNHYPFTRYISNNRSGVYIKYPVITKKISH